MARAFGVDVERVWVVGDAEQDVLAARAAGAIAVAVRGGFHDDARLQAASPHAMPVVPPRAAGPRSARRFVGRRVDVDLVQRRELLVEDLAHPQELVAVLAR